MIDDDAGPQYIAAMNKRAVLILSASAVLVCRPATSQITHTNLLYEGDPTPFENSLGKTCIWDCQSPPCPPFVLSDMNAESSMLVWGELYWIARPSGIRINHHVLIELAPDGTQTLLADDGTTIPGYDGGFNEIHGAKNAWNDTIAIHHDWFNSGDRSGQISLYDNGAITPIVWAGMPLQSGGTLPDYVDRLNIFAMDASETRGAFIAGDNVTTSPIPRALYVFDESGVSLVATSGDVDDNGLPIGEFYLGNLAVTDNGTVVATADTPDGDQFVVYDGNSVLVKHRFADISAADPDLDIHNFRQDGVRGYTIDATDDGRIAAIVSTSESSRNLVEFMPNGYRVLSSLDSPAVGGVGVVREIGRPSYSPDGTLYTNIRRDDPDSSLYREQVIRYAPNGIPALVYEAPDVVNGEWVTGYVDQFNAGSNHSLGVVSLRTYHWMTLVEGIVPVCLADVNGDGFLSPSDFSSWVSAFNTQSPACDQNGDAQCTPADFSSWVANYTDGC